MIETLRFQADIDELARVAQWLEGVGDRLDLPPATRFAIDLCLEEAISNVIRHGYPKASNDASADRTVSVGLERADDVVTVTIEDHGIAYDPIQTPTPARPASLDDATIGGLGVQLMRRFTQQMDYQRDGDTNRLILRIGTSEPAPEQA